MTGSEPVFVRLSRAWPITIGIHVFQCLFAATFALPFVASVSVPGVLLRPQVAEWLGALRLTDGWGDGNGLRTVLPLALAALNYPWLSVAWLRALSEEAPFTEHAKFALGRYRAALSVAASALFALGIIAAVCGLAAAGLRLGLESRVDQRAIDLARLACFVPGAWLAVWVVTLQDAGYAAISGGLTGGRRIARAALRSVRVQSVVRRCALLAFQTLLTLAAWAIPRVAFGPGTASDFVVLVSTQSVAFAITCLRAWWLAWLLATRDARLVR